MNHFFSDCYFNLGNIYYEQSDFAKADLCYKSSLEALEEDRKIQMYRHLDDDYTQPPQQEKSQIVTCGRICNMIAETSKEIATIDVAIKYYLKGIAFEPLFLDNIIDLSNLCYQQDESALGNLLMLLAKILQVEDASPEEQS